MNDKDFLTWIHARLEKTYQENPNVDYMLRLSEMAERASPSATPDVEPTAQVIDAAANRLRQSADDLDRIAARMREQKDLTYAAEATSCLLNALQNCRMDLLVTRPIRAIDR